MRVSEEQAFRHAEGGVSLPTLVHFAVAAGLALWVWQDQAMANPVFAFVGVYAVLDRMTSGYRP